MSKSCLKALLAKPCLHCQAEMCKEHFWAEKPYTQKSPGLHLSRLGTSLKYVTLLLSLRARALFV